MCKVRSPRSGWIACLLALALGAACSHSSTTSRIQRLGEQEAQLRESIDTLESRQQALRVEIERAQRDAEHARCQASVEGYRAVVAATFAEYSLEVAAYKGCTAQAAKGGGVLAAVGCGIAAFMTGGAALILCGGALVGGALMSESCDSEPPEMTAEDIRQVAEAKTGLPREPTCNGGAYAVLGVVGTGRHSLPSPYGAKSRPSGPAKTVVPVRHSSAKQPSGKDRRALRKAEKQRRKHEKRQKRRDKKVDAALEW
jgi:outer membrane murein-binding lipoprotein Lpp